MQKGCSITAYAAVTLLGKGAFELYDSILNGEKC